MTVPEAGCSRIVIGDLALSTIGEVRRHFDMGLMHTQHIRIRVETRLEDFDGHCLCFVRIGTVLDDNGVVYTVRAKDISDTTDHVRWIVTPDDDFED